MERPELVQAALNQLFLRFPPMAGYTQAELERIGEDLGYIVQFLEAALLTNDPRISWPSSCPGSPGS